MTDPLKQQIAIPAYFQSDSDGDTDWDTMASARALLGIVVFNPASGPGYTPSFREPNGTDRENFQCRITDMHKAGARNVVGYVTTNYRDIVERPNEPPNTVQREHCFTVTLATGVVTTRSKAGAVPHKTGWTNGFGPIQIRSDDGSAVTQLPGGLEAKKDYWWIERSEATGQFATSKADALAGNGINHFASVGTEGLNKRNHAMGLSRTVENIANVFFEIDQYYDRWPDIDGIFFDEMNNGGDDVNEKYYQDILKHVRTKGGHALVVQNPGTDFPRTMAGVADTFMTFENVAFTKDVHRDPVVPKYATYVPDDWMMEEPPRKFWHAIYACPVDPVDKMPEMIELSRTKNAGYIYVTDRKADIWNQIASNFADEITKIENENAGG